MTTTAKPQIVTCCNCQSTTRAMVLHVRWESGAQTTRLECPVCKRTTPHWIG